MQGRTQRAWYRLSQPEKVNTTHTSVTAVIIFIGPYVITVDGPIRVIFHPYCRYNVYDHFTPIFADGKEYHAGHIYRLAENQITRLFYRNAKTSCLSPRRVNIVRIALDLYIRVNLAQVEVRQIADAVELESLWLILV